MGERTGPQGGSVGADGTYGAGLVVRVQPLPGGDDEEMAERTSGLRMDLLDLDVAQVEPVTEPAPESSKGGMAAVGGWLAVNLGSAALRAVIARVAAWAARTNSTVELSLGGDVLKVTGLDRDQQQRLIDEWLARQRPGA
jgi:hypothetical protein